MTIRLWQQDIPVEANVAMSEESVYIYSNSKKSDHIQNPSINSIPDQKKWRAAKVHQSKGEKKRRDWKTSAFSWMLSGVFKNFSSFAFEEWSFFLDAGQNTILP